MLHPRWINRLTNGSKQITQAISSFDDSSFVSDKDDALSYSDKLLIIKDNQILAFNSPTHIYNNPKEKYVASLFDDVNEIIMNHTWKKYSSQIRSTHIVCSFSTNKQFFLSYTSNYLLIQHIFMTSSFCLLPQQIYCYECSYCSDRLISLCVFFLIVFSEEKTAPKYFLIL